MSFYEVCKEQKRFDESATFTYLQQRAVTPPSLKDSLLMTAERVKTCHSFGAGVSLFWGFQKMDDSIMKSLVTLAQERKVFEQMEALFHGEKVNTLFGFSSENRPALHPALRDHFREKPMTPEFARRESKHELLKLEKFFEKNSDYTDLVFIGIGGSQLGPNALIEALKPYYHSGKKVHFVSNVDPDEMTLLFRKIPYETTLVAVVSKSGTTLETATNEARARALFDEKGCLSSEHFIAITQPKTPMDDRTKYSEVFYVYDYVGGRYSSTSAVGGVLISFLTGYSVFEKILKGASQMDYCALEQNIEHNPALTMALIGIWNRNFLKMPSLAIIPYSQGLSRFVAHLQQCDMESNGKSIVRDGEACSQKTGPIIWGEPGTNAQHSFFQLLHQGTDIVPVDFIAFKRSQCGDDFVYKGTSSQEKLLSNVLAQGLALAQGKEDDNPNKRFAGDRPSSLIVMKQLTPEALGALLSLYEQKIAFQGFFWGINSFDQEGVQLGKVLSGEFLDGIQQRHEKRVTQLSPVQEALMDICFGNA